MYETGSVHIHVCYCSDVLFPFARALLHFSALYCHHLLISFQSLKNVCVLVEDLLIKNIAHTTRSGQTLHRVPVTSQRQHR